MTLRAARKAAKMTQAQLAAASGQPQQLISRIERGDAHAPSHRAVMAICRALHIDPRDIAEFKGGGRL